MSRRSVALVKKYFQADANILDILPCPAISTGKMTPNKKTKKVGTRPISQAKRDLWSRQIDRALGGRHDRAR